MSFNFDRRTFLKGAGAVGAASLLAACGEKSNNTGNGAAASGAAAPNSTGATPLKEFISFESGNRELESWNMLYTQKAEDANVVTNLWDGLLSFDCYGKVVPAIASSWEHNEDATVWTFHLRDDVDWVDCNGEVKAHLTSKDFLVGFEWVMNAIKNEANNTSMPNDTIVGAYEYYELTKEAGDAAADMTYEDMLAAGVGIEAPDDYTLVFTCPSACPYFDTVAAYNSFYPVAPALIEELGVDGFRSCDNTTMWYNGAYLMTSYVQGNEKTLVPNPAYWDKECTRFNTVTIKMVESNEIAYQMYQSGETDYVELSESNIKTISGDESNPYHDQLVEWQKTFTSAQMKFNYDKKLEDGSPDTNWNTAVANENFRKALYYGIDFTPYFSRVNAINPMSCENNTYTMNGLCYTSDGTDYTQLVKQELGITENGETPARVDATKAEEYKQKAKEELTAAGVTFPIQMDYYIAGSNQTALDTATVLAQCISDSMGDDFVVLNIKTYISSVQQEVYDPKLESIAVTGWIPDYGDPQNYLSQETINNDNAFYTNLVSNVNDLEETEVTKPVLDMYNEFTNMVAEADAVTDLDERYAAYAKAEAYMLDHAMNIPIYHDIGWVLTKINPYSKMNAVYGIQNWKMKNWETNSNGYTEADLAEDVAAHASSK